MVTYHSYQQTGDRVLKSDPMPKIPIKVGKQDLLETNSGEM